jgi:hypothetical protein
MTTETPDAAQKPAFNIPKLHLNQGVTKANDSVLSQSIRSKEANLTRPGQRMSRLFPELKNKDALITEFYCDPHKAAVDTDDPLNPDIIRYKRPDFGFNDQL